MMHAMPGCRLLLPCLLMAAAFPLAAHTVPSLEVEAEFTPSRAISLHVNLDARLFLAPDPTALPALPPFWWTDQSEEEHAKTMAEAKAYVARTLFFSIGSTKLEPPWKVIAVDSNSLAPLDADSTEVHLLCLYQGVLPEVPGGFQMNVAPSCAVGVILLNSMEGSSGRSPQSLWGGEPSRRFPLPEPGKVGASRSSTVLAKEPVIIEEGPLHGLFVWSMGQVRGADCLLALVVAAFFRRRFFWAFGLLLAYHFCAVLILALVEREDVGRLLWRHAAVLLWQTALVALVFFGCKVLKKAHQIPTDSVPS